MIRNAIALLALMCASCALAENVLYIRDSAPSSAGTRSDWYCTRSYAFDDLLYASVTVAIWVKDMTGQKKKFIAGVPDRWELCIPQANNDQNHNGKLAFWTQYGYAQADEYVLNDGKWHFVVGTFNCDIDDSSNNQQCLYVDGNLVASLEDPDTEITGGFNMPLCEFSLGAQATGMARGAINREDVNGYFAELSV